MCGKQYKQGPNLHRLLLGMPKSEPTSQAHKLKQQQFLKAHQTNKQLNN